MKQGTIGTTTCKYYEKDLSMYQQAQGFGCYYLNQWFHVFINPNEGKYFFGGGNADADAFSREEIGF